MERRHPSKIALVLVAIAGVSTQLSGAIQTAAPQRSRGQGVRTAQAKTSGTSKYFALVIGNNEYRHLGKLETAVSDANAIGGVLREKYGFESRLLLNADRDQILDALNDYRRSLDQNASLLIYYAGHGYYDSEAQTAYWIPVDAEKDKNSKWISAGDVTSKHQGNVGPARTGDFR
jgi:hypothetical protein